MTFHVLLDGDNIQWETFMEHVKDPLEERFGTEYNLTVFVQTNILIKYKSLRNTQLNIVSSRTTNKNASDARMLVEVGKLWGKIQVVIVSNDKIFEEVVDGVRIHQMGYTSYRKKTKLKKSVVIRAMRELVDTRRDESDDVFLCDLYEYLNCSSISTLKEYINKFIPELYVAGNDSVFFV